MRVILAILLLKSCSLEKPKFNIGDKVRFDIPFQFYYDCADIGTVKNILRTVTHNPVYVIETKQSYKYKDCPKQLLLEERALRKYFSIFKEEE
jgi:hypothetical protein